VVVDVITGSSIGFSISVISTGIVVVDVGVEIRSCSNMLWGHTHPQASSIGINTKHVLLLMFFALFLFFGFIS